MLAFFAPRPLAARGARLLLSLSSGVRLWWQVLAAAFFPATTVFSLMNMFLFVTPILHHAEITLTRCLPRRKNMHRALMFFRHASTHWLVAMVPISCLMWRPPAPVRCKWNSVHFPNYHIDGQVRIEKSSPRRYASVSVSTPFPVFTLLSDASQPGQ